MDESLVKLCSDKVAHKKFELLYGEKPKDKVKGAMYDEQKIAFFLAWDIAKRVTKKRVEEEIKKFFSEVYVEEVYTNTKGEKYISLRYIEELRI